MVCKKPFMVGTQKFGCKQCLPCRINKQRVWTHRILLESLCHEQNSFVTLTYSDEHLPNLGSIVPKHVELWLKRLRSRLEPVKIRYYGIGEYGDLNQRPHYHFALFGYGHCPDFQHHKSDRKQCDSPTCKLIAETWGKGRVTVDRLEQGSAQYVCGYVTKKLTNRHDERVQKWLKGREPEKPFMSRNPGIGANAMKILAGRIEEYGDLILEDGDVPLSLRHGDRKWPLGPYLRDKLRKESWLEDQKEVSLQKYQTQLYEEALQLQEEAFNKGGSKEFENRLKELKARDKQIIQNIEAKFKIFKTEGNL